MALKIVTLLLDWFVVAAMALTVTVDVGFGSASQNWPTAPATLIKSEVIQKRIFLGLGSHEEPAINYEYEANGLHYSGTRIKFGGPSWADAEQSVQRFKAAPLTIHYNPKDPKISCLEIGYNQTTALVEGVIGLVFLILSIRESIQLKTLINKRKS